MSGTPSLLGTAMRHPIPSTRPPVPAIPPVPTGYREMSPAAPANLPTVNLTYPCLPLALHYVKEEIYSYIKDIKNVQVKVTTRRDAVFLFADERVADKIGRFIKNTISHHESKINHVKETLSCCYLPVLAERLVQEKFAKIQVPFEMTVLAGKGYVSLETLAKFFSKCDRKTVESMKGYLHQKESDEVPCYQWYWEDDSALKPYDKSISRKLEQAYLSGLTIIERIGRFQYKIDPSNMEQTNLRTDRVRKIERNALHESKEWDITLDIKAHDSHLQEIRREVLEEMEKMVVETEFTESYMKKVPKCKNSLLEVARLSLVRAQNIASNSHAIALKGTPKTRNFDSKKKS